MEKYEKLIQAAIIAIGLFLLGLCIKGGFDNFTNKDRRVTVKGLAEKEVPADRVTWTISTDASGNELSPLYTQVNAQVKNVKEFLRKNGLEESEININVPSVTDNEANLYSNKKPTYRYTISRSITVISKKPKLVNEIRSKQGELLEKGIAIGDGYAEYEYTSFNQLKPEMMQVAIANAEKTAKQFAENSHSKLNKIVQAGQGEFSIDDLNSNTPYIKKVRVVSTITYSLKD